MIEFILSVSISCSAIDGDTIRCDDEHIRLLGIDAPEFKGHCRKGRICVDGDPIASKQSLSHALSQGHIVINRVGKDRYGRTLAAVSANGQDLSCWQIKSHQAVYVKKWDGQFLVRNTCQ